MHPVISTLAKPFKVARFWLRLRRVRARWRAIEDEDGFDARYGTDTSSQIVRENYGATPVRTFEAVVRALPAAPADSGAAFVDLGSGKGRAVLLASRAGFARAIGVEHSPELHRIAQENARRVAAVDGAPPVAPEFVCASAVDFVRTAWPTEVPVVLFLYCPFPSDVLAEVCGAIRAAAGAGPVTIAFVNPNERMRAVLEAWPGLRTFARHGASDPSLRAYESFEVFTTG